MPEVITIAGWRADAIERELASMWEAAGDGRDGVALYWFSDVRWLLASAREVPRAPGMPHTLVFT